MDLWEEAGLRRQGHLDFGVDPQSARHEDHFVGVLGEAALVMHLRSQDFQAWVIGGDSRAIKNKLGDVLVMAPWDGPGARRYLEVKATPKSVFDSTIRRNLVDVGNQMQANGYVLCHVPGGGSRPTAEAPNREVFIVGWLTMDEVWDSSLKVLPKLHKPHQLAAWLRG